MKKLALLVLSIAIVCCFSGCQSPVVYDDVLDTFEYKPECEFDYLNYLSPKNHPTNPMGVE